jgi:hypothetical protein
LVAVAAVRFACFDHAAAAAAAAADHTYMVLRCLLLFSALAACPCITTLEVHEYAPNQSMYHGDRVPPMLFTPALGELALRIQDTGSGCITAAAADRSNPRCNWLPSLVRCLHRQLQVLDLRLQAPLPAVQQPLLLQLTELRAFSCTAAQHAPLLQRDVEAVLLPEVLVQLSQKQQLRSLEVAMGPTTITLRLQVNSFACMPSLACRGRVTLLACFAC